MKAALAAEGGDFAMNRLSQQPVSAVPKLLELSGAVRPLSMDVVETARESLVIGKPKGIPAQSIARMRTSLCQIGRTEVCQIIPSSNIPSCRQTGNSLILLAVSSWNSTARGRQVRQRPLLAVDRFDEHH